MTNPMYGLNQKVLDNFIDVGAIIPGEDDSYSINPSYEPPKQGNRRGFGRGLSIIVALSALVYLAAGCSDTDFGKLNEGNFDIYGENIGEIIGKGLVPGSK